MQTSFTWARFPTWNWLDDGVLPLLIAIVRTCWVWPWLLLLQIILAPDSPTAVMPLPLVLLLPFISFTLARRASAGRPGRAESEESAEIGWRLRLSVGATGIITVLAIVWWQLYAVESMLFSPRWLAQLGDSLIHWPETSVPPASLLIVSGIALWLRGLLDAGRAATHDTIWSSFLIGVFMMVVYLLVSSSSAIGSTDLLVGAVLAMMAAGMGALSFSSLKITAGLDRALGFGERHLGTDAEVVQVPTKPVVNRHWFLSVGLIIGLLLGGGLLLTFLIAPETLSMLLALAWRGVSFVGDILASIFLALLYVVAYVFFWLYQWIEPLIQQLLARMNLDLTFLQNFEEAAEATPTPAAADAAPVPDEYRWLGLAIFTAVTVLLFALVLRRLSIVPTEEVEEVRESILSTDLLQEQLSSFWDRLLGRLRPHNSSDPFLALDGEESRRRIRAVYQKLLLVARDQGHARDPHLTPREYGEALLATPEDEVEETDEDAEGEGSMGLEEAASRIMRLTGEAFAPQLQQITEGYVAARYGDVPPSQTTAASVEQAWREIEREIGAENEPHI